MDYIGYLARLNQSGHEHQRVMTEIGVRTSMTDTRRRRLYEGVRRHGLAPKFLWTPLFDHVRRFRDLGNEADGAGVPRVENIGSLRHLSTRPLWFPAPVETNPRVKRIPPMKQIPPFAIGHSVPPPPDDDAREA